MNLTNPLQQELAEIDWNRALVRSNDYTSASYTLSPDAHRLLAVAISAIARNDQSFTTFRIYVKQLIEFYPALKTDKNAIARLDLATDSLMGSFIRIKQSNGRLKRHLIHSCQFVRSQGTAYVEIRLNDDMLPYLINLEGNFSAPKLENIRYFKKDQHFKLHAFFYSFLYRGSTWAISIEQIRDILDLEKGTYQLVGHLKSRLLQPSIKLINQVTDIKVTMKDVKRGRQIAGFTFEIRRQARPDSTPKPSKTALAIPSEPKWPEDSPAAKYLALGFSDTEFKKLQHDYGDKLLAQLLQYANHQAKQHPIKAMKSYLYGVLKNKPSLESLYTPAEELKQKQLKQQSLEAYEKEQNQIKEQQQALAAEQINTLVESYLESCSSIERQQLELAFINSPFARGLKCKEGKADLSRGIVKATFYRFVHKKYLDEAKLW